MADSSPSSTMDAVKETKDSASSGDATKFGGTNEFPNAGESSKDNPASSFSQSNDISSLNKKLAINDPQAAIKEVNTAEKAKQDERPRISKRGGNKEKKKDEVPVSPDSDSDDGSQYDFSQQIFNSWTSWMKHRPGKERTNQAPNLVRGLVDYLRVVDERINRLEANEPPKIANEHKTMAAASRRPDPNSRDLEVQNAVKFFNAAAYLQPDGSYPAVDSTTEAGTFMCGHDTQHLVRVLYSTLGNYGTTVRKQADPKPPHVSDIDILVFGVFSEAIATFFAKQMDMDLGDDHLIKFGKPFRPLLRNLERAREQLKKLENSYGQQGHEAIDKSRKGRDTSVTSLESPDAIKNLQASDILPFPPNSTSGGDDLPAYDKPAALPQFQTFLAFVDEYFDEQIKLYKRLRKGTAQYIAFEHLWMLFDCNDTIYCPVRDVGVQQIYRTVEGYGHTTTRKYTPQAYRVVATSGGMPYARFLAPTFRGMGTDGTATVPFGNSFTEDDAKAEVKEAIADILTQTTQISRRIRNNYTEFHLYCFYVGFNGIQYGIVRDVFVFKPYEGEMEIRNLEAYPVAYVLHDQLHERGRKFLDATKVSHLQYEGLTVGPNREEITSPVVVDVKLAFEGNEETENANIVKPKFLSLASFWLTDPADAPLAAYSLFGKPTCLHRWCCNKDCTSDLYIDAQKRQTGNIESAIKLVLEEHETGKQRREGLLTKFEELMIDKDIIELLPGEVPGFALRNRKWVVLNLMQLYTLEQNDGWDNLVLPLGHQQMVQAMVETHTQELSSGKDARIGMDVVKGKGRGCIILLHGVPGVGKTSTAECVASHTRKPLYPITCGDIGYRPEDVERNMEKHFKLAHKWGCVLLLDEADVFLAKRDQKDVQRNGLVSVFLRILEYYSGILFLTTNRVGAIDDAFRSRLHLTLYYPKLTYKQTKEIFKRNFARIADINAYRAKHGLPPFEYKDSEPKIMAWSKESFKTLRWNGRQIRNAFQTVLALAEFHTKTVKGKSANPVVIKKYFKIVASAAQQFDEYLKATHGVDEDHIARREMIRAPSYEPPPGVVFDARDLSKSDFSSEEEGSAGEAESSTSSESSDDSDHAKKKKKKKSKAKKSKGLKDSNKKKKTLGKGKAEKKPKEKQGKKKEVKNKDTDESEEEDEEE